MASVRKASAYSKRKPVINTRRSRKTQFSFVKMVPQQKIVKFNMGDVKAFESGKFNIKISILSEENVQIRDLALESSRQSLHKDLTNLLQKNFFLRCEKYPHNILRNNRVYSGGSKGERIQTGMSKSFGTPEGRAAIVKAGEPIFTAFFSGDSNIPKIRNFFKKIKAKLPCKTKIITEKLKENTLTVAS